MHEFLIFCRQIGWNFYFVLDKYLYLRSVHVLVLLGPVCVSVLVLLWPVCASVLVLLLPVCLCSQQVLLYTACFEDHYHGGHPEDTCYSEIYRCGRLATVKYTGVAGWLQWNIQVWQAGYSEIYRCGRLATVKYTGVVGWLQWNIQVWQAGYSEIYRCGRLQ